MVVSPLVEAVTESFYAWELRGRGWTVAPYPVTVEPPYRPCFMLPQFEKPLQVIDDGHRPTLLSSLVDGFKDAFRAPVPAQTPAPTFQEPAPYPAADVSEDRVAFSILTPSDFQCDIEATLRFLASLAPLHAPLAFELVGHANLVSLQIVCDRSDAARIAAITSGYFPTAAVSEGEDTLHSAWNRSGECFFVDFGLTDEFFLPAKTFRNFSLDPYISLAAALANAERNETLAMQVLFTPVVNRWDRAIVQALVPGGEPIFEDAPEFVPLAKEKIRAPLFAAVVRLAACAETRNRARELARGTADYFTQFTRPSSNGFIPLANNGYPDEEHEAAFLLRATYRTGCIVSAEELAGLVHLPDQSVRHPSLVRLEKRTKPLPREAIGHPLVLGTNEHHNREEEASVELPSRMRHMHVVGASGTGKSTLLLNLIEQDIAAGHGLAVLDPHGDLVDAVLDRVPRERYGDVVLFDPADEVAPVGINLLQAETPVEKTLLSSDLVAVFRRYATSWGDAMSTVLGNAVLALLESAEPATLLDLRRLLVEERFRNDFLSRIADPEVQFFWKNEFPLIGNRALGPILTRLNTFLRPRLVRNVVAQRRPQVNLENVVNGRKIFLAKLAQGFIGSENSYLLGSLIVTKFHQVAVGRQALNVARRTPYFLYIDEFQHFITPSIESLLTEARKYSIGLVLAHQTLHQLRDVPTVEAAVLGNAYTRVVMRVGDDDARRLAEGLSFFEGKDLSNLKQGEAIVRLGQSDNDFNLRIEPPVGHEANEAERQAIQARSREQFGTDAAALAAELAASYGPAEPAVSAEPRAEPEAEEAEALAIKIEPTAEVRPQTRPAPRQRTSQPPNDALVEGRGGKEHKYLQHLIKRLAEERGFRATLEQSVLGGSGKVDIALVREDLRIAVEISVSTGHDWEAKNVKQSLTAGFAHVLVVRSGRISQSFEKRVVEELSTEERAKVQVISTDAIVEYLDQFQTKQPEESMVRGYRVKVRRQNIVPDDAARRRSDVASVIARSIEKSKDK